VDRRRFLLTSLAGALAAPLTAEAQSAHGTHRIGWLRNGPPPRTFIEGFRRGLRELGYVEGQDVTIEYGVGATSDILDATASEMARKVDVVLASGTPAVEAAKRVTTTTPVVFVASIDAVATGIVASLAHPGGNITGLVGIHGDLVPKRLELLKEAVPKRSVVAVLSHPGNPGNVEYIRQAQQAAATLGLRLHIVAVRDAADLERAYGEAGKGTAAVQLDDVFFTTHRRRLVALALQHKIPTMYAEREFVDAGGLMAYGPNLPALYGRAAALVDKILKGAKPADLPVEQPTEFDLIINAKTAKTLGLTIPPSLLARADQVIE